MVSDAKKNRRDCSFAEGRASSRFRAGRTESSDVKGDAESKRLSYVPVGTKRQTYHIRVELIAKLRAYAYWERLGISEVVNLVLEDFFADKEVHYEVTE